LFPRLHEGRLARRYVYFSHHIFDLQCIFFFASSYIAGTNGYSNGIVPTLRAYDAAARYVDQGGNKRPGAFAIYLEPWHANVFEFLVGIMERKKIRARDLFYALWIPDLTL